MGSRRHLLTAIGLTAALTAAGCTATRSSIGRPSTTLAQEVRAVRLVSFTACDDLLTWFRTEALRRVGPYGLEGGPIAYATGGSGISARNADAVPAEAATPSGTNNQEAGVDEADKVKTDGRRVVTLLGTELLVADITGPAPRLAGRIQLGMAGERLFLVADRAYVVGTPVDPAANPGAAVPGAPQPVSDDAVRMPGGWTQRTAIAEVDLSATPRVVATRSFEGTISAGRLTGGAIRFVLTSPLTGRLPFVTPESGSPTADELATTTNRTVIQRSTLEDWLPTVVGPDGSRRQFLDCAAVAHPPEFSGFGTTSILTVTDGLDSLAATAVVADGGITYASSGALYLATSTWTDQTGSGDAGAPAMLPIPRTDIHRFAIAGTAPATYQGSGRLEGTPLNQYAMSEWQDHLRVATTIEPTFSARPLPVEDGSDISAAPATVSRSMVTVLELRDGALVRTGSVDGLGPNERIQGVRFEGPTGYVVTFRRIDPFYVLDLSDPTAPKALGELKTPGFSGYLHTVAPGRVLGVGVDATDEGRTSGAKVSLYDTSVPTAPRELSTLTWQGGQLLATNDPYAFTWDAERGVAILPASWYDQGVVASGAVVVRVGDGGLTEVGRLSHAAHSPAGAGTEVIPQCPPNADCVGVGPGGSFPGPIDRTFVTSGRLYALSTSGLSAHDPATLAEVGWLAF